MKKIFLIWIALVLPTLALGSVGMQDLRAGRYSQVDQALNAHEGDYEAGRISDIELLDQFRPFYSSDKDDEALFTTWLRDYPDSYAAHIAAAAYYRHVGQVVRGPGFTAQVSAQRLKDMRFYMAQARQQARAALPLSKKPLLAYVQLIGIAQFDGTLQEARSYIDRANAVAPDNFVARRKFMYALQTDWLGGAGLERSFVAEAIKAGLPARQVDVLRALDDLDEGGVLNDQRNYVEAWKLYSAGLAIYERDAGLFETGCQACIYLGGAAFANNAGDFVAGLRNANRLLQIDPDSFYGHLYRAQALNGLQRLPEAVPDLRITAAAGDRWSEEMLRQYRQHRGGKGGSKPAPSGKPH